MNLIEFEREINKFGAILTEGTMTVSFEGLDILVLLDPQREHYHLYAAVAHVDADPDRDTLMRILDANAMGVGTNGGHLFLDADSGTIVYSRRRELEHAPAGSFERDVQAFHDTFVSLHAQFAPQKTGGQGQSDEEIPVLDAIRQNWIAL